MLGDGVLPFKLGAHMTPLFTAAEVGHTRSVTELLESGADNKSGFSLLGLSMRWVGAARQHDYRPVIFQVIHT